MAGVAGLLAELPADFDRCFSGAAPALSLDKECDWQGASSFCLQPVHICAGYLELFNSNEEE
jgi:hypothetical protein